MLEKEYKNQLDIKSGIKAKVQEKDKEHKHSISTPSFNRPRALSNLSDFVQRNWKGWLVEGSFYIHGIVYMLVRVAVNITMSVQPFYLLYVTGFD